MKKSRFTEERIIGILKVHHAGLSAADLCLKHGITTPNSSDSAWCYKRLAKLSSGPNLVSQVGKRLPLWFARKFCLPVNPAIQRRLCTVLCDC
jgi:hypothetical protein